MVSPRVMGKTMLTLLSMRYIIAPCDPGMNHSFVLFHSFFFLSFSFLNFISKGLLFYWIRKEGNKSPPFDYSYLVSSYSTSGRRGKGNVRSFQVFT